MSETPESSHVLNEEHYRAFGGIVHMFARQEALMVRAMATLLETDRGKLQMIAAELPYRGKRDALLAMIKDKPLLPDQIERISWFLGELHKYNPLRNAIAHSGWTEGVRPHSVKPLGLSIRGGEVAFKGIDEEEQDYTDQDLIKITNELIRNWNRFRDYLVSINLLFLPTAED